MGWVEGYGGGMSEIVRFTISLETDLLEAFDRFVEQGKFPTRSEAIRQLIHDALVRQAWETDAGEVAGTLTLVYDHHRTQVQQKLVQLQHDNVEHVVATMHVHLDHDLCLEAIALRGRSRSTARDRFGLARYQGCAQR